MPTHLIGFEDRFLGEVEEIFFETSTRKNFNSAGEKRDFFYKYVGYYLSLHPELCFLAWDEKKILGYILGSPISDESELLKIQPHLNCFKDGLLNYPAHLHINLRAMAQGQGLGRSLTMIFEEKLMEMKIKGVHIITGANATNRSFYTRLGFNFELLRQFNRHELLFMGKALSDNTL
jgi:ribosomal protein S18 acetylase RimI-like enzyme